MISEPLVQAAKTADPSVNETLAGHFSEALSEFIYSLNDMLDVWITEQLNERHVRENDMMVEEAVDAVIHAIIDPPHIDRSKMFDHLTGHNYFVAKIAYDTLNSTLSVYTR